MKKCVPSWQLMGASENYDQLTKAPCKQYGKLIKVGYFEGNLLHNLFSSFVLKSRSDIHVKA